MIFSLMYTLLALLGLSFLIFIHELGHYFMARRVGMRVEVFSIGFGKPIFSWEKEGVRWQIGWLLLGGYVKIAGTESEDGQDPHDIPDGFFGKSPWDRIKVAFMGPFANLALAFLIFSTIWFSGGRDKNFGDFTGKIGWLDPHSTLYEQGIRPGDEITAYNHYPFEGAKDHLQAPMTGSSQIIVSGNKVNYATGEKTPFESIVKVYPHPQSLQKDIVTAGILNSANYIVYDKLPDGNENPLPEGSPIQNSGIQYGDRILWANGELVFSLQELYYILNSQRPLLSVERAGKVIQLRVPRVLVHELRPDADFREELNDWKFAAGLQSSKMEDLYTIPYNLTYNGIVENSVRFIDRDAQQEAFPAHSFSERDLPLQKGDKIIAVNGTPITHAYQLLKLLQTDQVNLIVQRLPHPTETTSWANADKEFDQQIPWKDLQVIVSHIGTQNPLKQSGSLVLLNPITPKTRLEFATTPEKQAKVASEILAKKKELEMIEDPEKRAHALGLFEKQEKQLLIGLPGVQDRKVIYNPTPTELFYNVFDEIWRTLTALFTGSLNPKWISGPIGIVQVVHYNWMIGIKEALFWLGAISLNLGILNLLPIPILDGGTIALSFFEMVSGRRLSPKTIEKLVVPFAILLIGFFLFLTYNDLSRLLGGIFVF
ncbi:MULTISPECIES: site-2 protease family protein [Parachlamydia]|jgi:regulator of sigma E protease|uniref:Putative zinc metaLLoprotease CPn_0344/CP_0416/CPj0344/CpB0350 n=2 Tax=Parachlamydia acanthamoebae TaxID=83552 RepID=F8KXU6_PARAV|nr:site-2 protease family protein [Parachlamydia acanthamoebae]EFB40441.1 hypothetical protein pah_c205o094 [Parachlamydia acanthamoebae str. Hall's coccus]KIA78593.1 putative zinc metalloprotease [Parachlamydia acanthamoebae]CCB85676.1 putative zinc metaLLoprotease CPn_0344/CP_0416/CPj0344/CpB0350 [Parachlamydia acanthamoebae UV-7]